VGLFFPLGGFFKDMYRPIESFVAEQGAKIQQTYLNAPKDNLYGAEIEVRKIFTDPFPDMFFLGGKDIFLQANYTWADSEVIVEPGDVAFPLSSGGAAEPASNFIIDGTRLQGQSEHVANFQLGWEDPAGASQGTLIVTYVSERSSARGRPGEPDFLQEPGVIMDFVYRRELDLFGQELSLNFKAQNLLDEEYLEHQMFGGGEVIVNRYDLGRSYSVGLSTRF
jgi:outer membrane receptor protein involved in Fe transport